MDSDEQLEKTTTMDDERRDQFLTNEQATAGDISAKVKFFFQRLFNKPILFGLLVLILFGVGFVWTLQRTADIDTVFAATYAFVPSELSKSAQIPIRIPADIQVNDITNQTKFIPSINGAWNSEPIEAGDGYVTYYFEPQESLDVGNHITVTFESDEGDLAGTFIVTENPSVKTIFPSGDVEVHEATTITIVFSRPMVPVTTLSELDNIDVPVTISPNTPGRFKWVSTRNLQFIPDTTLRPAAHYTVEIGAMSSLDGVLVEPYLHSFSTRTLAFESVTSGKSNFNQPFQIRFNMPVDKRRTASHITVQTSSGRQVPIRLEYGQVTRTSSQGKVEKYTDQRVIEVYPVRDSHGRPRVWDFDTVYELEIKKAYALFGVEPLDRLRTERIEVPNVVRNIRAESDRSPHVAKNFFDPQGTLIVEFYDEISLEDSTITAEGVSRMYYGERCKEIGSAIRRWMGNTSCEKVPDKNTVYVEFLSNQFVPGDFFTLNLTSLVAPDGFLYNKQPIRKNIEIYPEFAINSLVFNHYSEDAAVDHIYICSTTPLKPPVEEGTSSYISASERIVFGRWSNSRLISDSSYNPSCNEGDFQTRVNYGLLPETDYSVTVNPIDHFGQNTQASVSFRTQEITDRNTAFHQLQKQYSVTTLDKTTLTFAAENMTYMDMHICKTSAEQFLRFVTERPSNTTGIQRSICSAQYEERIQLPNLYWVMNYFQVDISDYVSDTAGHYILTFSHPNHKTGFGANRSQHFERTYLSVTDLSVAKKELNHNPRIFSDKSHPFRTDYHTAALSSQKNLYWVVDSSTLNPVSDVLVTQFHRVDSEIRRGNSAVTNNEGIARPNTDTEVVGAVIQDGDRTAVIANWADMLQNQFPSRSAARTYVYTDRPIYRPGQTVYLKGIDRVGFDGEFESLVGELVLVEVHNSRNENIYSAELLVSPYGTFSTEFDLPNDAPLGRYQITAFDQRFTFQVEEYEGSPFRLDISSDQDEYINGDEVNITIDAEYYFGAPVQAGSVSYSVVSQQYFFDRYQDGFYNFGSRWYYCYTCWFGDRYLYRGEVELDENGQATISELFNLNDIFPDDEETTSRLITYNVTVTNNDGQSVSTQHSFIVHYSDIYLGARVGSYVSRVNEPISVGIKTVDTDGSPVRARDVKYTVYHVTWNTFRRQEVDGGFYFHSEKQLTEVLSDTIQTNQSGDFADQIRVVTPGSYEMHVSYTDTRGNTQTTIARFFAQGEGSVSVPRNNNYTLDMEVVRAEVSVNDTGSVLITTPYDKARALITTERGQIFTYEVVDITNGLYVHEFPVTEEYIPNVYVTATLHSAEPAVQYNSVEFFIDRAKKRILVEVTPDKSSYNPGDQVTLDVKTLTTDGQPISAEVSIAVADLSVLALVGNPKKDPLQFFYNGFEHSISTASNLKNLLHEVDIPDGTKGGDGVNPEDLATQPRGVFRDTAFWDAEVVTDSNGHASVSFTLPDNLTTWQIEAVAVTEDTKLGTGYREFVSRKELMVQPLAPRFLLADDTVYIGAQVFNQTDSAKTFTVVFDSQSLPVSGHSEQSIRVRDGESETVFFPVTVPKDWQSSHSFTISASSNEYSDAVLRTIPMRQNLTQETVATAGVSRRGIAMEYLFIPDTITTAGTVSVSTAPTIRGFFEPIELYIAQVEQSEWFLDTLYQVATLAYIYEVADIDPASKKLIINQHEKILQEAIDEVIKTAINLQRSDGGFAYRFDYQSSVFLTSSIIPVLLDLRDLGYDIDDTVISSALSYINNSLQQKGFLGQWQNYLALQYAHWLERTNIHRTNSYVNNLITNSITNTEFISTTNTQLLLGAQLSTGSFITKEQQTDIVTHLKNRITQSGRGAALRNPGQINVYRISEQIRSTAHLLELLNSRLDDRFTYSNEMARWLLAVRDSNQRWYSDQLTYHVVRALHTYASSTETGSINSGAVSVTKSGTPWLEHNFSSDQLTVSSSNSLDEFTRNRLLPLELIRTPQGSLYYDIVLSYTLPAAAIPPRDEGITIQREVRNLGESSLSQKIVPGDILVGELIITVPDSGHDMVVSAPIPAGFTLVNLNLATEDQDIVNRDIFASSNPARGFFNRFRDTTEQLTLLSALTPDTREPVPPRYRKLPVQREELTNSAAELYISALPAGVYTYKYYMRAQIPGTYNHLPAIASLLEFPEVFGRTTVEKITISQ